MAKIEAPNKGYNGTGPGGVVFSDGVGETDNDGALNYYRGAGYTVDGKRDTPDVDVVDSREVADEQVVGTRLRDAAVDPQPVDFLAPVNAGKADPHGADVVSPEVHASGPAGIRPGVVFVEDTDKQEARESAFVETRLIDQESMAHAVAAEVPDVDARGDLGLSDPGSAEVGKAEAKDDDGEKSKTSRTRKR